jgi:hypothetical protein
VNATVRVLDSSSYCTSTCTSTRAV